MYLLLMKIYQWDVQDVNTNVIDMNFYIFKKSNC
jgi:hypothetical protein